jgi:hypothetical protein
MTSCLESALHYADFGWPVFPCYSARAGACCCRRGAECRHVAKLEGVRRVMLKTLGQWPDEDEETDA